uniref:G-protein coupled receptors family 1 profile domain-containing protein n=1 Tax=Macaca fascicularis TaxID=9541 RepID=A0A7N9ICC1_MACFA
GARRARGRRFGSEGGERAGAAVRAFLPAPQARPAQPEPGWALSSGAWGTARFGDQRHPEPVASAEPGDSPRNRGVWSQEPGAGSPELGVRRSAEPGAPGGASGSGASRLDGAPAGLRHAPSSGLPFIGPRLRRAQSARTSSPGGAGQSRGPQRPPCASTAPRREPRARRPPTPSSGRRQDWRRAASPGLQQRFGQRVGARPGGTQQRAGREHRHLLQGAGDRRVPGALRGGHRGQHGDGVHAGAEEVAAESAEHGALPPGQPGAVRPAHPAAGHAGGAVQLHLGAPPLGLRRRGLPRLLLPARRLHLRHGPQRGQPECGALPGHLPPLQGQDPHVPKPHQEVHQRHLARLGPAGGAHAVHHGRAEPQRRRPARRWPGVHPHHPHRHCQSRHTGAVVIAFVVCWLPYHVRRLMFCYISDEQWTPFLYDFYHYFYMVTNALFYVSSTINPILYNLVSANFRHIFLATLACLCPVWRRRRKRPAFSRKANSVSSNHTLSSNATRETLY